MASMSPKPKVEIAREHLSKAQEEAGAGDLRDGVQWSFASLRPLSMPWPRSTKSLSTNSTGGAARRDGAARAGRLDVLSEVEAAVEIAEDEAK
jgi:hypothetical protein